MTETWLLIVRCPSRFDSLCLCADENIYTFSLNFDFLLNWWKNLISSHGSKFDLNECRLITYFHFLDGLCPCVKETYFYLSLNEIFSFVNLHFEFIELSFVICQLSYVIFSYYVSLNACFWIRGIHCWFRLLISFANFHVCGFSIALHTAIFPHFFFLFF